MTARPITLGAEAMKRRIQALVPGSKVFAGVLEVDPAFARMLRLDRLSPRGRAS